MVRKILFGSILLALVALAAPGPAQFRQDLEFFARELPKRHKNAFHFTSREHFQKAVEDLRSRLDTLDEDTFYAGLVHIAAMIGDAHTRVWAAREDVRMFPVSIAANGGDHRLMAAAPGLEKGLGARIVQIDDTPAGDLDAKLRPLVVQNENPTYEPAWVNLFLNDARILHGAGITRAPESATFLLEDDSGTRFPVELKAMSPDQVRELALVPFNKQTQFAQMSEPMRTPSPTFSYTYVPTARTVYADVRGMKDVAKPATELFKFIREKQPDKLIVDLRRNPGGNYFHGLHSLIEPIAKLSSLNHKGHLFVLIGPMTGSAAIVNSCQFHTKTNAILVGQPIGAKPTEYMELKTMTLPATHLVVGYSVRFYDFSFNPENVVVPDHEIVPTWEEVRNGRNPVIEWCLNYPADSGRSN